MWDSDSLSANIHPRKGNEQKQYYNNNNGNYRQQQPYNHHQHQQQQWNSNNSKQSKQIKQKYNNNTSSLGPGGAGGVIANDHGRDKQYRSYNPSGGNNHGSSNRGNEFSSLSTNVNDIADNPKSVFRDLSSKDATKWKEKELVPFFQSITSPIIPSDVNQIKLNENNNQNYNHQQQQQQQIEPSPILSSITDNSSGQKKSIWDSPSISSTFVSSHENNKNQSDTNGTGQQNGDHRRSVFDTPQIRTDKSPPRGFKSTKGHELPEFFQVQSDGTSGYGTNIPTIVFTELSAPDALKASWGKIWNELPITFRSSIQMDQISCFSVTPMWAANKISEHIVSLIGKENTKTITITDATACVGGNTVSFARYFGVVNAIELDKKRYEMLINNTNVCREAFNSISENAHKNTMQLFPTQNITMTKSVNFFNGNCLDICKDMVQDIIFVDPPWGGMDYQMVGPVKIFLGGVTIYEVTKTLLSFCRYVAMKLPYTALIDDIVNDENLIMPVDEKIGNIRLIVIGKPE